MAKIQILRISLQYLKILQIVTKDKRKSYYVVYKIFKKLSFKILFKYTGTSFVFGKTDAVAFSKNTTPCSRIPH